MDKYTVKIMPDNISVSVEEGTNLLMAAKQAGIAISSPCGGQGTCGKCAVKLINGYTDTSIDTHLPQHLKEMGFVLSCKTAVKGDMTIEIPPFARVTKHKVLLGSKSGKSNNDYLNKHQLNPVCKKLYIKLEKPGLEDSLNDVERLRLSVLKNYGIDNLGIPLNLIRQLPLLIRQGDWEITLTIVQLKGMCEVVDIEPGRSNKPPFGIAVDIGTTTVVVNLLDMDKGETIDSAGAYNKQSLYGSDVISRIIYCDENPDGLELLQKAVLASINELIGELASKNGLKGSDISVMAYAGNTVMTHLFMKVPATYLRLEPYTPAAVKFPVVRAKELGIGINPDSPVITVPSVASYVGGDITAGVLANLISESEKLTLFVDVGTNGELVLGNSDWLVTCSCSAGPAFEGSGISCGMRAMDGAIDWIEIDSRSFEVGYRTIGNTKPLGICGSGLIYSISEMMEAGIIDRSGKIMEDKNNSRIRRKEDGIEYVIAYAAESGSGGDIVITEGDIKNLLRAKGAIFAGIRTMLQQVQLDINDIDRVYIAGGFGNYINITDAINIGLFPDLPLEKYKYIGNSSIQGAATILLSGNAMVEAESLADRMTYLELSIGNMFMDEFISALFIPHTDLGLFPSMKR